MSSLIQICTLAMMCHSVNRDDRQAKVIRLYHTNGITAVMTDQNCIGKTDKKENGERDHRLVTI